MSLIGTLFIGLIVGWLARWLKPGSDKMGLILTTVLGVAGSFFATYAGKFLGLYQPIAMVQRLLGRAADSLSIRREGAGEPERPALRLVALEGRRLG